MRDSSLRAALRSEIYEYLGRQHADFLNLILEESPYLEGAAIGAAVLRILDSPGAAQAAEDPERFFDEWIRARGGGDVPRRRKRDFIAGREAAVESENLKWVGLAILVAVAGGTLWLLLRRASKQPDGGRRPSPKRSPAPTPAPIRVAVAVFAGKLPAATLDTLTVADLIARATYWWVGTAESWAGVDRSGVLGPPESIPRSEDTLVVVVVDMPGEGGTIPTSRPEASSLLRSAAARGSADLVGHYAVADTSSLVEAGFRR